MKLGIVADIHGNLPAFNAVLSALENEEIDCILVAGDLVGGAPFQNEIIEILKSLNAEIIKGNVDDFFLKVSKGITPPGWANNQWAFERWAYQNLDNMSLKFLKQLPEQKVIKFPGKSEIRMVHGSPNYIGEFIDPDENPSLLEEYLRLIKEEILIFGHTHHPWIQEINGKLGLNPGSVCFSRTGIFGAQYALMTWNDNKWIAEGRNVEYDLSQLKNAFKSSGLLENGSRLAEALLLSIETGQDYFRSLVTFIGYESGIRGYKEKSAIPDDMWDHLENKWQPSSKIYGNTIRKS